MVRPTGSPRVCDMRCATARAARRRGSNMRMRFPRAHDSSRSARGTTVLLPAPGGACRTTDEPLASASRSAGSVASMGRPEISIGSVGLKSVPPDSGSEANPSCDQGHASDRRDNTEKTWRAEGERVKTARKQYDPQDHHHGG